MLGTQIGICHVAHHNMATPEADLALLFLRWAAQILANISLDIFAGTFLEHLELHPLASPSTAPPHVCRICRRRGGSRALTHAVDLINLNAKLTKVLKRLSCNRRGASETEFALVQTQRHLNFAQHQLVGKSVECWFGAAATHLTIARMLEPFRLRPRRQHLFDAFCRLANCLHFLGNFLPDAWDPKEHGGLHTTKTVADRAHLEIVGTREGHRHVAGALRTQHQRNDDIHHHACHVRERKEGEYTLLHALRRSEEVEMVQRGRGAEDDVVMRNHDGLWVAGSTGCVDVCAHVARLKRSGAFVKLLLRYFCANLRQLRPLHYFDSRKIC
mmetsp:Transcript_49195/g.72150  ORF Transcript_49195/g.72150 Transcript_49195/m.72150 type:complete len:329 (+) Transcript_49195:972-1958(+)